MIDIFAKPLSELEQIFTAENIKPFRARQVYDWLYDKQVFEFAQMKNLGAATTQLLEEKFTILMQRINILQCLESRDKNTCKTLLEFADKNTCETVLMRHDYGNSICVSSQIGCAMACKFCASGLLGFVRNLTAGEMLAQVMYYAKRLAPQGQRVSHVVIMGSGEPLLNYENVLEFIRLLHDQKICNISYRNITLSTSGIVPNIKRLMNEGLPINLAISLHAVDNTKRSGIMPINNKYPLEQLLAQTKEYANVTKRQVTYEYVMIKDVNDTKNDAENLVRLLRGHLAHVNLIPINTVTEHGQKQSEQERINSFCEYLQKNNTPVTIRKEMGADINAACGQLRNQHLK